MKRIVILSMLLLVCGLLYAGEDVPHWNLRGETRNIEETPYGVITLPYYSKRDIMSYYPPASTQEILSCELVGKQLEVVVMERRSAVTSLEPSVVTTVYKRIYRAKGDSIYYAGRVDGEYIPPSSTPESYRFNE